MRSLSVTVITEGKGGNRILASEYTEPWNNTARPTGQELQVWTCAATVTRSNYRIQILLKYYIAYITFHSMGCCKRAGNLQLKTKLLLLTLYPKLPPQECLGYCKQSLSGGGHSFSMPRCSISAEINNTLHEQNYYNASLALCFYMYYCWENELHLKLLKIVFVKKQKLGTRQGPSTHDMLIYSPDPKAKHFHTSHSKTVLIM